MSHMTVLKTLPHDSMPKHTAFAKNLAYSSLLCKIMESPPGTLRVIIMIHYDSVCSHNTSKCSKHVYLPTGDSRQARRESQ